MWISRNARSRVAQVVSKSTSVLARPLVQSHVSFTQMECYVALRHGIGANNECCDGCRVVKYSLRLRAVAWVRLSDDLPCEGA